MARVVRVIDEGPEGQVELVANEAYFITHEEEDGLVLTEMHGAIEIEEDGTFYYTVPYDATLYGRAESRSRVKYGSQRS